jgi:hypothetical protein
MHQDGVIQLEVKLTGILSTYAMAPGESAAPYGTEVYPGVNAHHHQHLFCLRLDPSIDGHQNTVFEVDSVASDSPVGSKENRYGNAFMTKKTPLKTMGTGISDYQPIRTWDISNTNKLNPHSKNPVSYKIVSREVPGLMPKENSLVWDRAGFARHALHVTKYADEEKFPAGRHVPQNSGRPSQGKSSPNNVVLRSMFNELTTSQACQHGSQPMQTPASKTRTSSCGTRSVSLTSRRRRTTQSCLPSPCRCCFVRETSSRRTRQWTSPRRSPARLAAFAMEGSRTAHEACLMLWLCTPLDIQINLCKSRHSCKVNGSCVWQNQRNRPNVFRKDLCTTTVASRPTCRVRVQLKCGSI